MIKKQQNCMYFGLSPRFVGMLNHVVVSFCALLYGQFRLLFVAAVVNLPCELTRYLR